MIESLRGIIMGNGIKILGTGSFLPETEVTNDMFAERIDTSDEWISSRTGIRSRHFADSETNTDMAGIAAQRAIENAGVDKSEIKLLIVATVTSDYFTPSMACMLQKQLDLPEGILAFDLNAACSGFVYSLITARALLQSTGGCALIVGSEMLSRMTDFTDRASCVLFGDGAGAAVIKLDDSRDFYFMTGARGDDEALVCRPPILSDNPFVAREPDKEHKLLSMNGSEVFRFAVECSAKSVINVMEQAGVTADEVDMFIMHQANERIIASSAKRLKAPIEKFPMNISKTGNTSAASVPILLDELNRENRFKDGDKLVISGFGGGLTYGAVYLVW